MEFPLISSGDYAITQTSFPRPPATREPDDARPDNRAYDRSMSYYGESLIFVPGEVCRIVVVFVESLPANSIKYIKYYKTL